MGVQTRTFFAVLVLGLAGCASGEMKGSNTHPPPPDPKSTSAASLVEGQVDTGFLFFGQTRIRIASLDCKAPPPDRPLAIAPGAHILLVTAFRDPVSAFACISYTFEAGKSYVARSTKPFMETTTMWIEDAATGEAVSDKVAAQMIRSPVMFGPALNQAFFGTVPSRC